MTRAHSSMPADSPHVQVGHDDVEVLGSSAPSASAADVRHVTRSRAAGARFERLAERSIVVDDEDASATDACIHARGEDRPMKAAPCPTSLRTSIQPPWSRTMP